MKKPQVDFIIPSIENEDEGMVLHFTSVEEIDSVIESLEEARSELEQMIEMYRQKRREKKQRQKNLKRESLIDNVELPNGTNIQVNTEEGLIKFGGEDFSVVFDLKDKSVIEMLKKIRGWSNEMRKDND